MEQAARQVALEAMGGIMQALGQSAKAAAFALSQASPETKNKALRAMAGQLRANVERLLAANQLDVETAKASGRPNSFLDRLTLSADRVEAMAKGLEDIADLPDPVGTVLASWERPNGLKIERVRVPIGVIGIIYESRPNVTADAGGLCLKSGNAVILRGGSESYNSSLAIHGCLVAGLIEAGLPENSIQIVPMTDRSAVGFMLTGLGGNIDVIVPRGGRSLVERVQEEARVPVFAHLEGICHVYVEKSADIAMAKEIIVNSKMRRTGICGAAETLLIDRECVATHLKPIADALIAEGCELRGDQEAVEADTRIKLATVEDWSTEYLDAILSIRVVDGIDRAIHHIATYGSDHTEAIISEDPAAVEKFFNSVDSAILVHNASTQFADGGEFGMGAEIGIATGKMHARGPVGVEQLTSFKYLVRGAGQTRPK